jgi:hypothetical protein
MLKQEDILGHPICLLIMGSDSRGEDEWTVHRGEVVAQNGMPRFSNPDTPKPFPLPDDTFRRIKRVMDDNRDTFLGCEFVLALSCGSITNEEAGAMIATGLHRPEERSGEPSPAEA